MQHSLPPFELIEHSTARLQVRTTVQPELACFEGHFPDQPLVPGIVQLGWVIQLAHTYTALEAAATRVDVVKFHHVIAPGTQLDITLNIESERSRVSFTIESAGDVVHATGRIRFGRFDE